MRLTTIHSAVATVGLRVSGSLALRTTGASSRAPFPSSIRIASDRGWRFAPKPASPPFSKARKRSAAPPCGWARAPTSGAFGPDWVRAIPPGRRTGGVWPSPQQRVYGCFPPTLLKALSASNRSSPLGSIEFNYRAFSSPRWSPDGSACRAGRHQRRHVVGGGVRSQQRQALLHLSARRTTHSAGPPRAS